MIKSLKVIFVVGFILLILLLVSWISFASYLTKKANKKVDTIFSESGYMEENLTEDEKLIILTRNIHERFNRKNPNQILALRFRPYITNSRLPEFLSLPVGVIETHIEEGLCDNASRMLAFTLSQEGYSSTQWNMITLKSSGHAALQVTKKNNEKVFLDPFYGVVGFHQGELIDLETAQTLVKNGAAISEVIKNLNDKSDNKFYKNLPNIFMGAEGEDLLIETKVPVFDENILKIGELDGDYNDVLSGGKIHNITAYWHYVGHKYNREWVRILSTADPIEVTMTLIDPVENSILTMIPEPLVNDKTLTWVLGAGDSIKFYDNKAKVSLRRLNSFIEVDQIIFRKLN